MAEFYARFLTSEYNKNFAPYIIYDCGCYQDYANFKEVIYEKSGSYLCCLVVVVEGYTKEFHRKWPIMLGSFIDFRIRGKQNDSNLYGSFIIDGSVKVIYNFITNNLTSGHVYRERNAPPVFKVKIKSQDKLINLSYNPSSKDKIAYTIYDEKFERNQRVKQRFKEIELMKEVENRAKIQNNAPASIEKSILEKDYVRHTNLYNMTYKHNIENSAKGETWIEYINSNNPFGITSTEEEYIEYFHACLENAPELDELANKTCISPNTILLKVLLSQIAKVSLKTKGSNSSIASRLTSMGNRLTSIIRYGNMFFVLANKIDYDAVIMTDFKSIYQTIEAQKLHLTSMLTSTVKRFVSTCTINSSALFYPKDGMFFTCTIDTKEIKGAGESVSLAQLVITPCGIKIDILREFFEGVHATVLETPEVENEPIYTVVINSFITPYRVARSRLIKLKKMCVILNFMLFEHFLVINTNGHVLMKYSLKYKFFVTPYEHKHFWPDAFQDYADHLKYNPCSMFLSSYIDLAQSAKRNVANSNVKGRCNLINDEVNLYTFLHTIGASNSAIYYPPQPNDTIATCSFSSTGEKPLKFPINLKKAHLRFLELGNLDAAKHPPMPPHLIKLFETYKPLDDKTEQNGMCWNDLLPNADKCMEHIFKQLSHWYNPKTLITVYPNDYTSKDTYITSLNRTLLTLCYDNEELGEEIEQNPTADASITLRGMRGYLVEPKLQLDDYNKLNKIQCNKKHPSHMYINVAFGDIYGGTNEDGIVIDKKLYESNLRKLVSQTLNVRFKENVKILKKYKTEENRLIYRPFNRKLDSVIFYGLLESGVKLAVVKSKNIKIIECHVGETFRYLIVGEALSNHPHSIESVFYPKTQTVNIHFRYFVRLGIGMKLSNLHGQKGIVSTVADLSNIVAYKANGQVVHPQLLFSAISVIGRTISSQLMSMYTQEDLAFTPDGMIVAPQGINWHHIEPSNKSKISAVKNDLMTSENGFVANELSFTPMMLKKQSLNTRLYHPMHLVQQLMALQGSSFNFLSFDKNVVQTLDPDLEVSGKRKNGNEDEIVCKKPKIEI